MEGIQSERFGKSPGRVSNLPTEHLAGAGLALPSELSCTELLLPQAPLGSCVRPRAQVLEPRAHRGHSSSLGRTPAQEHCTTGKLTGLCSLHPGLCTTHRMPWCPLSLCTLGHNLWKELNFDKEKTSKLLACSPKLNQINSEAQQPAHSSHKRRFLYC